VNLPQKRTKHRINRTPRSETQEQASSAVQTHIMQACLPQLKTTSRCNRVEKKHLTARNVIDSPCAVDCNTLRRQINAIYKLRIIPTIAWNAQLHRNAISACVVYNFHSRPIQTGILLCYRKSPSSACAWARKS